MEALRNANGFLGSNASLLADLTLLVQIFLFIVLCLGIYVQLKANRGNPQLWPWHDRLQSFVVVLNLLFIIFVMVPTFSLVVSNFSRGLTSTVVLVPTIHAGLGTIAQGLGIYCLLAGFKILPRKIGVLRYWMWTAFAAWTMTILFGVGVYFVFYTGPAESAGEPVAEHDADLVEAAPTEAVEVEEIVEEHAEEPVEIEPTPTPAEVVAVATEEPTPAAEAPERLGILRFSDGEVHSDRVTLQMQGVTPLDANLVYEGWLQGQDSPLFSIGILPVEGDSIDYTFIDPQGWRLLDLYNAMLITVEPVDDGDPKPSEIIAYSGEVAPSVMEHVRHVVTTFPDSPDGDGLALNALAEAARVVELVDVQQGYVADNNLVDLFVHVENTINILEGTNGPNHGDLDGDGEVFSGDGFGLLRFGASDGYLQSAAEHATLASQAEGASAEVMLHAEHVNIAAENAIGRAEQIRELQLQILQVGNAADAAELVARSVELAKALVEGLDADGDGQIAPVPGEGGVRTMYEHGQLMGGIEIFAVAGPEASPAPEPTPTPELISEHDGDVAEVVEPEFAGEAVQAQWLQLTAANTGPGPRFEHGLQYNSATNQIFLFGGRDGSQDYNDTWVLSLADLTWRQLAVNSPVAPPPRHNMVMIVDEGAESLYVAVGQEPAGVLNDVWRLDLATETWEDLTAAAGAGPASRYGSPGGNLGDNLLLTHGFGNTRYDDTWLFNTNTGQWEQITPAGAVPLRRCLFAATVAADNLVMHGGCASGFGDCYLDDTWVLDTTASAWRELSTDVRPVGRQHQSLVSTPDQNQVVLFGGQDASRTARNDAWLLDLASDSWQPIDSATGPQIRYNHAAVWVGASGNRPAGMLVYGGRSDQTTALSDMWLLSLGQFATEAPAPAPTATTVPTPTPELISEHDGG